jgi:predicted ester cyclase
MSGTTNQAIVRRFLTEVWNGRDLAVADELCVPPYARDERRALAALTRAFPDLWLTIDAQVAAGETVMTSATLRGTHEGPLMLSFLPRGGLAPTDARVAVRAVFVHHVIGNQIQQEGSWSVVDWLGLLLQLGAYPAPPES